MNNITPAWAQSLPAAFAATPAATPLPNGIAPAGAGFDLAAFGAPGPAMIAPERFVATMQGGVILGADGQPTGSVPANSFIDTTSGKVYGADGKPVAVPEGGSVDFFDLPDLDTLRGAVNLECPQQAPP